MGDKFNIGDFVYVATHSGHTTVYTQCPDCAGKLYHTITLGCGDTHTIECQNCKHGYEGPTGRVSYYAAEGRAEYGEVIGIEITPSGYEYQVRLINYTTRSKDVFATKEEAQAKADEMSAVFCEEQKARVFKKEKDTRSWAWNASYHRQCLKRAQRELEYHTAMLDVAKVKAKEDKQTA